MSDDNKSAPRAPLNIPAGNSPITPDSAAQYDPEAEKLTGDWWEDRKRALKVGPELRACCWAQKARRMEGGHKTQEG